jgi:glycosyltransferase involved in cell wall biosynthesis
MTEKHLNPRISAVIHTYNAAHCLTECLESVRHFADEMIVCDMQSTDATCEIAQSYGARIIFHENVGYAEPARLYAISHATGDWILSIDADERFTPELAAYLLKQIGDEATAENCYMLPILNIFLGRGLKCDWPNYHARFFRKDQLFDWPVEVHRGATVYGGKHYVPKQKELSLQHYSTRDITEFIDKLNRYTTLEQKKINQKDLLLPLWLYSVLRSVYQFIKLYAIKGGFRDGYPGFCFAVLMSVYKFVALVKYYERRQKSLGL